MRLVFMGTPELAVTALRALHRDGHEMLAVVTQPDRPRRKRSSPVEPSPVKVVATRLDIPVLQPESIREPGFCDRLRALSPETIIVVAYGQILPAEILSVPPRWCINLHASLLPRYRGAAPVARAIMQGEKVTGVTTMKMDRGLDTGDLLLQRECAIGLTETSGELTSRLAEIGAELLLETLTLHRQGALEPRPQNAREATLAPPLKKEDGLINWKRTAVEIASQVRGCNPWPLTFTFLKGVAIKVLRAEVNFESAGSRLGRPVPGRVIGADDRRIVVQCQRDSRLALLELRFPGKRTMSAHDALNGRLIQVGDTFAQAPSA
jgi:methionyl-tRNA formyltransferase